jgi:hypothetical protein
MQVICISAKARHGKDTAAKLMKEYLESVGKRVLIIHYADLLKFICTNYFGWDGNKDDKGRTLLQHIGTDTIRAENPSYWVDFVINLLKIFKNEWDFVLIPDCRCPIEVTKMEENFNTKLIRVYRPCFDNGLSQKHSQHPLETAMDNYNVDVTILNDSDIETFKSKLVCFLKYEYNI